MAHYFKRFTTNPQADLERGFSFVGYQLFASAEKACEWIAEQTGEAFEEDFDLQDFAEENIDLVGQDNVTGLWGQVRSGLCAYGPFESIEEALADDTQEYGAITEYHIFEGTQVFNQDVDGHDEGVTFRPISLIS